MSRAAKIRVLIVDDEAPARDLLRRLLSSEPDCVVAGECATAHDAQAALRQEIDLLFLDIRLPDLSGVDLLGRLDPKQLPAVVFVTAHEEYAVRAFELSAVDYLLKPFARARFHEAVARARARLDRGPTPGQLARLQLLLAGMPSRSAGQTYLERLPVSAGSSMSYLPTSEIDRIESDDHCLRVWARRRMHVVSGSLSGIESQLDPGLFVRIHRTVIVNRTAIATVRKVDRRSFEVKLRDGSCHRLSRRRRTLLASLIPDTK